MGKGVQSARSTFVRRKLSREIKGCEYLLSGRRVSSTLWSHSCGDSVVKLTTSVSFIGFNGNNTLGINPLSLFRGH